MAEAGFLAMRAELVECGLLDAEHRLTAAGNTYVDELIERLPSETAPCDPDGPRVFWLHTFRQRRRAA